MADNDWSVGDTVTNGIIVVGQTTGTATIRYVVNDAGVTKWLQSDAESISTTPHSFSLPYVADEGFVHDLVIPAAMDGMTGSLFVTDPATGADCYSETFEVGAPASDGDGLAIEPLP